MANNWAQDTISSMRIGGIDNENALRGRLTEIMRNDYCNVSGRLEIPETYQKEVDRYLFECRKYLPVLLQNEAPEPEWTLVRGSTIEVAREETLAKAEDTTWRRGLHAAQDVVGDAWSADLGRALNIAWPALWKRGLHITRGEVCTVPGAVLRGMTPKEAVCTTDAALNKATSIVKKFIEHREVEMAWTTAKEDPLLGIVINAALDAVAPLRDKLLHAAMNAAEVAGRKRIVRATVSATQAAILRTALEEVAQGLLPESAVLAVKPGTTRYYMSDAVLDAAYVADLPAISMLVEDLDFPENEEFFKFAETSLKVLSKGYNLLAIIDGRPLVYCTQIKNTMQNVAEGNLTAMRRSESS